ncbi:hypothetical protein [Anaeromyxobacter dehalogenans]|uniref:Uncharacterized protein n=1 Tax=Anaeromyxobacter dehalogenans (strain 2CP-C) TaxID=290397 RepID=Q2IKB9_ANADE|nr:hypothetical protein [Anaeromyxobacter dehalogenans]ABC82095.1 hypothetical protein Adeh_2325 [Anaeromyxobacter dehalogenans 2CP-C]
MKKLVVHETGRKTSTMTPAELRSRIQRLRPSKPVREQLMAWLDEYDGPGFYNRKGFNHSARFAYNHLQSPSALLWLAGAAGVPPFALRKAKTVLRRAQPNTASEAAAVRSVLPWELVQALLLAREP